MKWKKLYDIDYYMINAASVVLGGIAAFLFIDAFVTLAQMYRHRVPEYKLIYSDSVRVSFRRGGNPEWGGIYFPDKDEAFVYEWELAEMELEENGCTYNIPNDHPAMHEIRHARNHALLGRWINTDANELSARVAEGLMHHALIRPPVKLDRDFIKQEQNSPFVKLSERFYPVKDTTIMVERDFNYMIDGEINVDEVLTDAIRHWKKDRKYYDKERQNDMFYGRTHTPDADLALLFTYKINGVNRSLFREATQKVQQEIRNTVNEEYDPVGFMAKYKMSRE